MKSCLLRKRRTCMLSIPAAVTNTADRKSRQMLHKAKQANPSAVVVAAGCYVNEVKEKLLEDPAVDIIIGNNEKKNLLKILKEYEEDPARGKAVPKGNQLRRFL